jgi:tRNA (cmo5U34)-methyltransferase
MRINNTLAVFDATASTYDRDRGRLIPCFERLNIAATEWLPEGAKRILDLGAGSGLFTEVVHRARPEAEIHLMDFSEPMLALARERLRRLGEPSGCFSYEVADYTSTALQQELDAVVSALSIHHLEDEAKRALFAKVFAALKPGGLFINADHVAGPTPELELVYQERWLAAVRANGASEEQIADSLYRQQEDRRASVQDQLRWLTEAGFVATDCWYKDGSFAVFVGMRPEQIC